MHRNQQALHCLDHYLIVDVIQYTRNRNWQQYLINMAIPYEKGQIEGGPFCLQWISIIFKVNIQLLSSVTSNFVNYSSINSRCSLIVNIMSFKIDTLHIHYEPMIQKQYDNDNILQYAIVTKSTNANEKFDMHSQLHFNNDVEFEISSYLQQVCPTKFYKLNYHRMKQFIHTRGKSSDMKQFIYTRGKCNDICNNDNILPQKRLLETKQSISEIGFDSQDISPTKCPRLSYHKIKQFIGTRGKCNDICNNQNILPRKRLLETKQSIYEKIGRASCRERVSSPV